MPFAQATIANGDVRAQTQPWIDNIRTLIEEAGGSLKNVVKCTVYVTGPGRLAADERGLFRQFR